MQDKLELKHWTSYLPHKVQLKYCVNKGTVWTLDETNINSITTHDKLILRPLSDLTKEIEVNDERFIPIEFLTKMFDLNENYELRFENNLFVLWDKINEWYRINDNNFILFQKLFEWHFDVFGLIEKGLAIDKNSLQK